MLAPLDAPKKERFSLHPKQLPRHPLSPVFVAMLRTGLGKQIVPTMVGLLVCAAWLFYDLWPLATRAGVLYANRFGQFRRHWGDYGKGEAEVKRESLRKSARSIAYLVLCSFVCMCWLTVSLQLVRARVAEEATEVDEGLVASLTMPEGARLNNAKFTISNGSSHAVHLETGICWIRYGLFERGYQKNVHLIPEIADTILRPSGDGYSMNCPATSLVESGGVVCADVVWSVLYALMDDPKSVTEKDFRFVLYPGEKVWSKMPADGPTSGQENCLAYKQAAQPSQP
jgi:hypothetical protein